MVLLEVCIDSIASGLEAQRGGAGRVELCDNLIDGGTTPSSGMVSVALRKLSVPVVVLIRPRGGDFVYSDDEMDVMVEDIKQVKTLGAYGVVIGVLTADGRIDAPKTSRLIEHARPMKVTFHRAIDVSRDPLTALQTCIDLGVDRVLSSGQAASAEEGAAVLREMVEQAGDKLSVMGGGGLSEHNCMTLVKTTGLKEVHGSLRESRKGASCYTPARPIYMGGEKLNTPDNERQRRVVSSDRVAACVQQLQSLHEAQEGGREEE